MLNDDNQPAERYSTPTSIAREEAWHHTTLPIQGCEQLLHVEEPGLDLDDEQGARRGMPSDDVDRTAISVMIEGQLRHGLPAPRSQVPEYLLHDGGVTVVEKARYLSSEEAWHELDRHANRLTDETDDPQVQPSRAPCLHQRYRRLIDAGCRLQIHLAPAAPYSRGSNQTPNSAIIHEPMFVIDHYRRLIDG
jgi:hypothetical protein